MKSRWLYHFGDKFAKKQAPGLLGSIAASKAAASASTAGFSGAAAAVSSPTGAAAASSPTKED